MRRNALLAVGALLLVLLGWRFSRAAKRDSCLKIGGSWHAESGTCGGMPLPVPGVPLAIAWVSPESMPQLQGYQYKWPEGVPPAPECLAREPILSADSIGPIHTGQELSQILAICPHPLVGWDWGDEGIAEPALMVRFGSATIMITLSDTTPSAIAVYLSSADSTLVTSDGVRVGMAITRVNEILGPLDFGEGECALYTGSDRRPHLSILLTLPTDSASCGNLMPKPPALPQGSKVARLIVHRVDGP